MKLVTLEVELFHLTIADGDALGIGSLVDLGADTQSCVGRRGADETDDGGQAGQGLSPPVHGDV